MRKFPTLLILCITLFAAATSCVVMRGGHCEADAECETHNVCFRNWCMPEVVRDRLLKVQAQRQDGGLTDQKKPDDPTPDNPTPDGSSPDGPCSNACELNRFEECYPKDTKGCTKRAGGYTCEKGCTAGQRFCVTQANQCTGWTSCRNAMTPKIEECNGQDEDCDGKIDQDPDGNPLTRSCYGGPDGTRGEGICRAGTQTCTNGQWDKCTGDTQPDPQEACNNGKDDNCNGATDEGCVCKPGATQACGPEQPKGECKQGTQTCGTNGQWGSCIGLIEPQAELCDNKDNNCDGQTDENVTQKCYEGPTGTVGTGPCKEGVRDCTAGVPGVCLGQVKPEPELCNGIDDDCDGKIDLDANQKALVQSCYTGPAGTQGKGTCATGTQVCNGGKWGTCTGEVKPAAESCVGTKDEDCDGVINEGCKCTAGDKADCGKSNKSPCQFGKITCDSSGNFGACVGHIDPTPETCNGKDDDCNGTIDKDLVNKSLTRKCYSGPANSAGTGICTEGTATCNAGKWGSCVGEVKPTTETCNGKDDDCDGQVDGMTETCYTGPTGTQGKGICKAGTRTCATGTGTWSKCSDTPPATEENCTNGIDDDCDGKIDNGCVTTYAGTGTRGYKDGPAAQAQFGLFGGMASDGQGNVYVTEGYCIRRIYTNAQGLQVETLAGDCNTSGNTSGSFTQARFADAEGIVIDTQGNILIGDRGNNCIRKLDLATKKVSNYALGCDPSNTFGERPTSMVIDATNTIYATVGNTNQEIVTINPTTQKSSSFTSESGSVTDFIGGLALGPAAKYLYYHHRGCIYKTELTTKTKVVLAGSCGNPGYAEGDLKTQAKFSEVTSLVFADANTVYLADQGSCIRKIDLTTQKTTTVAGACKTYGNTNNTNVGKARFSNPAHLLTLSSLELLVIEHLFLPPVTRFRKVRLP